MASHTPGPNWELNGLRFVETDKLHGSTESHHVDAFPIYAAAPGLLASLKIALPYVEKVAATAPTEMARQQRQRQASKDAQAIRTLIAEIEKASDSDKPRDGGTAIEPGHEPGA